MNTVRDALAKPLAKYNRVASIYTKGLIWRIRKRARFLPLMG